MPDDDRFRSLDFDPPPMPAERPKAERKAKTISERLLPKADAWFKSVAGPLEGLTPGRRAQTITLTSREPIEEDLTYTLSTTIETPCLLRSAQVSAGFDLDQVVINRRCDTASTQSPAWTSGSGSDSGAGSCSSNLARVSPIRISSPC